uniref:Uncharacterized protein n=1 Tax=Phenylobacterium glaciei TaxID=2803784 RepID=A0A974SA78_9CAUL|nr:hypothetical protein JKL49_10705 [Phenylobacterium glaciei]
MGNAPEINVAVDCATGEMGDRQTTNFDAWVASNYTVPKQYEWRKGVETKPNPERSCASSVVDKNTRPTTPRVGTVTT